MRVWIVTVGEELPIDQGIPRLLRAGMLSEMMAAQDHSVIWWTSTFNHALKKRRATVSTAVVMSDKLKLILLHGVSYQTNVSLSRLANHAMIGNEFKRLASAEVKPDVILCSFPTIELSLEATRYGRKHNVPVVVDIRDLWPDIFLSLLPRWLRWLGRVGLYPLQRSAKEALHSATAIVGITPAFVEWGVSKGGRQLRPMYDRAFPLAYSQHIPNTDQQEKAYSRWQALGVQSNMCVVCFFGTMGHQFELETVLEASSQLVKLGKSIQFVLCGDGPNYGYYKLLSQKNKNVIFPGWANKAEIWTLMRIASMGLAPYKSERSFTLSIPNKAIEYLSAGLPLVTSLDGALKALVTDFDCGAYYTNGDVAALVSILGTLSENETTRRRLSSNAYALYLQKFKAEDVYGDMISYLSMIGRTFGNLQT